MIEAQATYVTHCISHCVDHEWTKIQVKQNVVETFMAWMWGKMESTVWKAGSCESWYKNKKGEVPTLWPSTTFNYIASLSPYLRSIPKEYDLKRLATKSK